MKLLTEFEPFPDRAGVYCKEIGLNMATEAVAPIYAQVWWDGLLHKYKITFDYDRTWDSLEEAKQALRELLTKRGYAFISKKQAIKINCML